MTQDYINAIVTGSTFVKLTAVAVGAFQFKIINDQKKQIEELENISSKSVDLLQRLAKEDGVPDDIKSDASALLKALQTEAEE